MTYRIELEQEDDGRWLADVMDLNGVMAYGATPEEAIRKAKIVALQILADMLEHGELDQNIESIAFIAA